MDELDQRDACYLVAIAPEGLVLAQRTDTEARDRSEHGPCCLAYLGTDTASRSRAAPAALAAVMPGADGEQGRGSRP